ncbi:zinc finger protein 5-like [Hibiscus syriacus]|uniref:Zinc finger protein 5-like n=1 Tax=Hibiscus syriacus TaxID=106335 RepID=A0A6A2XYA3_HIBSY|nr:zinc finger protein 5-like [Hibiscus syriacus]
MAEASRGRVTITLGRTGQVVKRAGHTSSGDFSDSHHVSGSKRSVRDRLGSNVDGSLLQGSQLNNNRQRGDGYTTSLNANGLIAVHIGKNDLRFKLMQKNVFRRAQSDVNQKDMDLRAKLSRTGQPYETYQMLDSRVRIPEPRERVPDSRETSIPGRIPYTRSADDFPRVTTSRSSYSPWTSDHLRQCSPDRVMGTSRGLSPPRNVGEIQRRQVNKTYDDVRAVSYMGKDVFDAPGPVSTTSFVTKLAAFTGTGKVCNYFQGRRSGHDCTEADGENGLKELGIPMGPRKKILLALLPRPKRQP